MYHTALVLAQLQSTVQLSMLHFLMRDESWVNRWVFIAFAFCSGFIHNHNLLSLASINYRPKMTFDDAGAKADQEFDLMKDPGVQNYIIQI